MRDKLGQIAIEALAGLSATKRWIRGLVAGESGNVGPMFVVALTPVIGAFGLATEGSNWYFQQRVMQNAADSAVVSAAVNAGTATSANCASTPGTFDCEAKAVAAKYGFTDGMNNVRVVTTCTATTATGSCSVGACPFGASQCYTVQIHMKVPLYLFQLVGYKGDDSISGSEAQHIMASATAAPTTAPEKICLLALASNGASPGILGHGIPNANLNYCNTFSNTDNVCTGHNMVVNDADASGSSTGCGIRQYSHLNPVADPYSYLGVSIPPENNACHGSYPQESDKGFTQLSSAPSGVSLIQLCGDQQLKNDITIASPTGGTVVVIYNGQLDTNGYRFANAAGSSLTLIFTGSNGTTYTHSPQGGGTIDITAPTSGTWSGVAIYQDPNLTTGTGDPGKKGTNSTSLTYSGNSPTWNLQGLVYMPHADLLFNGAINKSTNGLDCYSMVINTVQVNGTGDIFEEGQCQQAGLNMPTSQIPGAVKIGA